MLYDQSSLLTSDFLTTTYRVCFRLSRSSASLVSSTETQVLSWMTLAVSVDGPRLIFIAARSKSASLISGLSASDSTWCKRISMVYIDELALYVIYLDAAERFQVSEGKVNIFEHQCAKLGEKITMNDWRAWTH